MQIVGLNLPGKGPKPLLPPLVDGLPDYLRQPMNCLVSVGKVLRNRIDRTVLTHLFDHVDLDQGLHVRLLDERP